MEFQEYGIWIPKKQDGGWSKPERVILNDDVSLDGCPFVLGNETWFCSVHKGNYREVDLYISEFRDGKWTNWRSAGRLLNVVYEVGKMHITADGEEMHFQSAGVV